MAKYKKMMPPRRTNIRGQDHLLAYITPEEAEVLKARGGTGEAGPMGIPSFPEKGGTDWGGDDDVGDYGADDSGYDGADTGGYGGGDGGSDFAAFRGSSEEEDAALQQDIAAAAAIASGVQGLGNYQFESGDIGNLLNPQTYKNLFSGKGLNIGQFNPLANRQAIIEAQRAVLGFDPIQTGLSQIASRMQQAQGGYGLPCWALGLVKLAALL